MKFDGIFDISFKYNYYEAFDECIAYLTIRDKEYGIDIELDLCKGADSKWYGKDISRMVPTPYIKMIEQALNTEVVEI